MELSFAHVIGQLEKIVCSCEGARFFTPFVQLFQGYSEWPSADQLNEILWPAVKRSTVENCQNRIQSFRFANQFSSQKRASQRKNATQTGAQLPWPQAGPAAAYVHSIFMQHQIPTRFRNLHDFANALTWAAFPRAKACLFRYLYADYQVFYENISNSKQGFEPKDKVLNGCQGCQGYQGGSGRGRGKKADRLTILDEAGVIRFARLENERDRVFLKCDLLFFGHALLEHLVLQKPQLNAPTWTMPLEDQNDRMKNEGYFVSDYSLDSCFDSCFDTAFQADVRLTRFFESALILENPAPDESTTPLSFSAES